MFNFFGKSDSEHEKFLVWKIQELQAQVDSLKATLKDFNEGTYNSTFAIDFNVLKVIAIVRTTVNDYPKTVIGYLLPEGSPEKGYFEQVREWNFYCSEEQHEKLVAEFNKYK
jgi:hypothetical protein